MHTNLQNIRQYFIYRHFFLKSLQISFMDFEKKNENLQNDIMLFPFGPFLSVAFKMLFFQYELKDRFEDIFECRLPF